VFWRNISASNSRVTEFVQIKMVFKVTGSYKYVEYIIRLQGLWPIIPREREEVIPCFLVQDI